MPDDISSRIQAIDGTHDYGFCELQKNRLSFLARLPPDPRLENAKNIIGSTIDGDVGLFELYKEYNPTVLDDFVKSYMQKKHAEVDRSTVANNLLFSEIQKYFDTYGLELTAYPGLDSLRIAAAAGQLCSDYDMFLGIAPEGLNAAAIFSFFGWKGKNVYVDEGDPARPYKEMEPLDDIEGRRILLLEDDVVTGLTLERVLERITYRNPSKVDLLLTAPSRRQYVHNIPKAVGAYFVLENITSENEPVITENILVRFGI